MSICFIKSSDKYYYTYGDRVYELNSQTYDSLKNKICLPLTVYFRDCPMSFIGNISSLLFDEAVDVKLNKNEEPRRYQEHYDYEAHISSIRCAEEIKMSI